MLDQCFIQDIYRSVNYKRNLYSVKCISQNQCVLVLRKQYCDFIGCLTFGDKFFDSFGHTNRFVKFIVE